MVQAKLTQFSAIRMHTLDLVQPLSQEQMDFVPTTGEWSVGEVVDHLLLAEKFWRGEIERLIALAKSGREPQLYRSLAELNPRPAFLPKGVLPLFEIPLTMANMVTPRCLRSMLVQSDIIPIETPDIAVPRFGRPANELRFDLHTSLAETETLIAANSALDYNRMFHEHLLLGTQNVPQVFQLLTMHEERHHDQISAVLAHTRFPQAAWV